MLEQLLKRGLKLLWQQCSQHTFKCLLSVVSVASLVILLRGFGLFQGLELVALDQLFWLHPPQVADSRIIIVAITEADISRLGRWPMTDATLLQLLQTIQTQKPRIIGLDLYRNLPIEPGYAALAENFRKSSNLIGIQKIVGEDDSTVDAPAILKQKGQVGASDLVIDIDGRIRRNLLYLRGHAGDVILSLGAKLAFSYLEPLGIQPETLNTKMLQIKLGKAILHPLQPNYGGYIRTDAGGYQILANFRRFRPDFSSISLTDLLENHIPIELIQRNGLEPLRDRIVLIGVKAESLKDHFYTSINRAHETLAGVEVHAHVTSQLLSAALGERPLLQVGAEWMEWVWIVLWAGLGGLLGATVRSSAWVLLRVGLAALGLVLTAYLFFLAGWWLITVPALFALIATALVEHGRRLWQNLRTSQRKLEEYASGLEQKVELRTLELAQEKEELRQQKELMERIIHTIPVMLIFYNSHQQLSAMNRECQQVLGYSKTDFSTVEAFLNYFPDLTLRSQMLAHIHQADGQWYDLQIQTRSGELLDTAWSTVPLANQGRVVIGQNICDRKRAEAASILEERNRLAREIHDTLAQTFAGILLHIGAASLVEDTTAAQIHISTVDELARTGLTEARRSVAALRPKLLEERTLPDALRYLATQMTSERPLVQYHTLGEAYPLSDSTETHLLRIGQEAVTNAIKHAKANQINILLHYQSRQLCLKISDDGQGFDYDRSRANLGFGLLGMQERSRYIGAVLTLRSQPNQGTEVIVILEHSDGK